MKTSVEQRQFFRISNFQNLRKKSISVTPVKVLWKSGQYTKQVNS
ncbi:Uncharacterised protein [Candidatus Venteria ishoeyi]|uniref:Uncharacterized protein n=1 Tax=Candidatus Venteria ishoeyi TaxID=1899563 RepID=A0A1H6FH01_9GAMM|nr:Uncharacterised protein [Candidatus Venteria ishoeyi]SEH09348.1 Uncharacterised protein [Candidatus Venteria ishoeyi]